MATTAGRVVNTTVAGNHGGGICQYSRPQGPLTIVNSIIWGNEGPNGAAGYDFRAFDGPFSISYSIVGPGGSLGAQILGVPGNLLVDPAFANLAGGDVHLSAGSPAVDTGTTDLADLPETDKDGGPRVLGAGVDMGAYELGAPTDSTPPVITLHVEGTQGRGGWYVSDVHATWEVLDGESAISSVAGCDDVTMTTDSAGLTLTCTATSGGGTATASVTIKRDATPPQLSCAMTPSTLWPPDRRLVPVTAQVAASDANGASVLLASVTSSEPGSGATDMQGFLVGTDDRAGLLRAARPGTASARVYTLRFEASDPAGNVAAPCYTTVVVPHSQGK